MAKKHSPFLVLFLSAFSATAVRAAAQNREPNRTVFHVTVDMVQLDVAVTDKKGNYVTRLSPGDFAVFEDGIRQKIATFGEVSEPPRRIEDFEPGTVKPKLVGSFAPNLRPGSSPGLSRDGPSDAASPFAGASVFILFDTSNYMYRGFVFAQDAIADFVRSLDHPDRLAFYSYSRNFSRGALLTPDRSLVLRGVRATVAGDDAALYDALLMTLKDAAKLSGRKVAVVFSNGPDNASVARRCS
jgi:Ca-activated chloride channel family protein